MWLPGKRRTVRLQGVAQRALAAILQVPMRRDASVDARLRGALRGHAPLSFAISEPCFLLADDGGEKLFSTAFCERTRQRLRIVANDARRRGVHACLLHPRVPLAWRRVDLHGG